MYRTLRSQRPCSRHSIAFCQPADPENVFDPNAPPITTIEHQGRRIAVGCRIGFDGVEYVGRLWFAPEDGSEAATPDRAAIPGRSRDEVLERAQELTSHELAVRYRRAISEKRRYLSLRKATDEI